MTAGRSIITDRKDWGTPPVYVGAVRRFFGGSICLDPCSGRHSIVRADVEFSLPRQDGLSLEWDYPRIYVNPPYGIDRGRGTRIGDWLQKCADASARHGSEVLALVPVATDTGHWKRHVFGSADAVCFLGDTRLRFLVDGREGGVGAPMACAMVCWSRRYRRFLEVFGAHGAVVDLRHLKRRRRPAPPSRRRRAR